MVQRTVAILCIIVTVTILWSPCGAVLKDYRFLSKNITSTLDHLLNRSRYDKRIRPDFGGPPVTVTVNMHIKSMGQVSETDQNYVMDCYFRQTWYDRRLVFNFPGLDEFSLSWLLLDRVWKPDTYFLNGQKSYLHRITVPNKFLRLRYDGFLMYSMRLTVKASCPMHLRKFPLDSQTCPLLIGSYGYRSSDVLYKWDPQRTVAVEDNVELSQYELVNITTSHTPSFIRGIESYSIVNVTFHMRRNIGYFILQLYVPCGLIVCCSWVNFWIDPDAVPARITLGVTTALSMTTMGFGGRANMPRVSYATAFDSFVIICFSFVFAAIIEYAAINFIDKVTADIKKILQEKSAPKASPDPAEIPAEQPKSVSMLNIATSYNEAGEPIEEAEKDSHLKAPETKERRKSLVTLAAPLLDSLKRNIERRKSEISIHLPSIPMLLRRKSEASIHKAPIPLITVTGNEGDEPEAPTDDECIRRLAEEDVVDIGCDEMFTEDGEAMENIEDEEREGFITIVMRKVKRITVNPKELWKKTHLLPTEEDVARLLVSGETPDKFSIIDIQSRKYFPIAFCILITGYWLLYVYYITDEFPTRDISPLLAKSKCVA